MKRRTGLALILVLTLLVTLLAGCGSSSSGDSSASSEATAGSGDFGPTEDAMMDESAPQATAEGEESAQQPQQTTKLIYRGDLELETTSFDDVTESLLKLVESCGGYVESSDLHNYDGSYRYANYTVRVPAEQYRTFFSSVGELCHVTWRSEETENITRTYYDTAGRLATQQAKLTRLQELLRQAESMEDIITIESAISDTEYQIESLSGEMRTYDDLVNHSTVTIHLREVYQLSNVGEPANGFGGRLGNALISGLRGFFNSMENLLVALAYGWVWVLLAVIVAVLVLRRVRKDKQKQDNAPARPKFRLGKQNDKDDHDTPET